MKTKTLPQVDHTPAKLDEESRVLLSAANYIEEHGWYPSEREWSADATCAYGAIVQVIGMGVSAPLVQATSHKLVLALGGGGITTIWHWNDAATKEAVIAKMRAVALGA